jgi:hypothetical protein
VLGLESSVLFLTDAHPHFEFQINLHLLINMYNISGTFDMPFGLDGNYRKSIPSIWDAKPRSHNRRERNVAERADI